MAYDKHECLRKLCRQGLANRYGIKNASHPKGKQEENVLGRLDSELEIIERMGFAERFLLVRDIVTDVRGQDIFVGPGRGAEAGSLVCYLLGITGVDPLKYRLFMERFLNPERGFLSSFMLDSCKDGHYTITDHIKNKHGRDKTAALFTVSHHDLMTTVHDIARFQRMPSAKINHILKIIRRAIDSGSKSTPKKLQALNRKLGLDPAIRKIMDDVHVVEELCRHSEFDLSGIVIGDEPLQKRIPAAMTSAGDLIALSDETEDTDCMEIYVGGSGFMGAIAGTLRILKKKGMKLKLESIPLNDPETFKVIRAENAFGVFQLKDEPNNIIAQISPTRFEHLIPCAWLGPHRSIWLCDDYLDRKTGATKIRYDHSLLEPILRETYGMFFYQEQWIEAAHVLTGCTPGQAEMFRRKLRTMSREDYKRENASFVEGCRLTHGIPAKTADRIFNGMSKIACYLFSKAHAVCAATIAYQLGYLKAHYPVEFEQAGAS